MECNFVPETLSAWNPGYIKAIRHILNFFVGPCKEPAITTVDILPLLKTIPGKADWELNSHYQYPLPVLTKKILRRLFMPHAIQTEGRVKPLWRSTTKPGNEFAKEAFRNFGMVGWK